MATILDTSVIGDLQCEPNATAGEIIVTTNNVTPNRNFNIRIVASNSRESTEITDNGISKRFFVYLSQLIILLITNFLLCL